MQQRGSNAKMLAAPDGADLLPTSAQKCLTSRLDSQWHRASMLSFQLPLAERHLNDSAINKG